MMKYTVTAFQRHRAHYTVEAESAEDAKTAVANGKGTQVANSTFQTLIDSDDWTADIGTLKAEPADEVSESIDKLTRPQMVELLHFVGKPMHPTASDEAMRLNVKTLTNSKHISLAILRKMFEMDGFEAILKDMSHADMLRVLLHTGRSFPPGGPTDDLRAKLRALGMNREIWVEDLRRWKTT